MLSKIVILFVLTSTVVLCMDFSNTGEFFSDKLVEGVKIWCSQPKLLHFDSYTLFRFIVYGRNSTLGPNRNTTNNKNNTHSGNRYPSYGNRTNTTRPNNGSHGRPNNSNNHRNIAEINIANFFSILPIATILLILQFIP